MWSGSVKHKFLSTYYLEIFLMGVTQNELTVTKKALVTDGKSFHFCFLFLFYFDNLQK